MGKFWNDPYFRIQMPYCIWNVGVDRWCLLNREYMPVGMMRPPIELQKSIEDDVLRESHAKVLHLTEELYSEIWHGNEKANPKLNLDTQKVGDAVFLYYDGNSLRTAEQEYNAYQRRYSALKLSLNPMS